VLVLSAHCKAGQALVPLELTQRRTVKSSVAAKADTRETVIASTGQAQDDSHDVPVVTTTGKDSALFVQVVAGAAGSPHCMLIIEQPTFAKLTELLEPVAPDG